jgi:hypothetical protein
VRRALAQGKVLGTARAVVKHGRARAVLHSSRALGHGSYTLRIRHLTA